MERRVKENPPYAFRSRDGFPGRFAAALTNSRRMSNIEQHPGAASLHIGGIATPGKRPRNESHDAKNQRAYVLGLQGNAIPVVKQPVLATRRIYPVKCVACTGKGKITDAD